MASEIRGIIGRMAQRRLVLASTLLIFAIASYVFFAIADEVAEGEVRALDEKMLLSMRSATDPSDPIGPAWLEETALEITAVGGYSLIILSLVVVTGLLLIKRHYGSAFFTVFSVGSGALVSYLLKQYYERPRPDLVAHLDVIHTASFPSGHATVTTIAYLTLAALVTRFFADWRLRLYVLGVAIFVAFIVGLSRIYLGVHWPSDVAAGWALGAAWASLSWLVATLIGLYRSEPDAEGAGKQLREEPAKAMEKP